MHNLRIADDDHRQPFIVGSRKGGYELPAVLEKQGNGMDITPESGTFNMKILVTEPN